MEKGVFILSLDTELAWGWTANRRLELILPQLERVRDLIPRLLSLLEKYQLPATWALVGRLFAEPDQQAGRLEVNGRLRAAADLVETILESPVGHEIASHSFAHPIFSSIDRSQAETDLRQAVDVANLWHLNLKSFVFPGNQVGHLDCLARFGFRAFRGPNASWFDRYPRLARRVLRQLDLALALRPTVTRPVVTGGLVNLAGNMIFRIPSWGLSKRLPASLLATKAIKGIRRAIQERALFHLWFHPFNFGHQSNAHFGAFEATLRFLVDSRSQGLIETTTMGAFASQLLERAGGSALRS